MSKGGSSKSTVKGGNKGGRKSRTGATRKIVAKKSKRRR